MHGRPRRALEEPSAEDSAKAAELRDLHKQLLHFHNTKTYTNEAVALSAKLIEINPEVYTAWNYRKLAFLHNLDELKTDEAKAAKLKIAVDCELHLVELALRQNPKSYGTWYHRKWILSQNLVPPDFHREFMLLSKLLKVDARNFHGWNYRRFLACLKGSSEEEELWFTKKMIDDNFSNYSAWHNRSMLLSKLLQEKRKDTESNKKLLSDEFELVSQALFTDPSDQSGWFYHIWLLAQASSAEHPSCVASWPSTDIKLTVVSDKEKDGSSALMSSLTTCFSLRKGILPIVLCYSEPVKGISSSSVTVNSSMISTQQITWKALSVMDTEFSSCWVAYLKIHDEVLRSSQIHSVEVILAQLKEVISKGGSVCDHPFQIKFTVDLKNINSQEDQDTTQDMIVWDSYSKCTMGTSEIISLGQMRSAEVAEEDSNWQLRLIADEINLFKDIPEDDCKFVKLTLARLSRANTAIKFHGHSSNETQYYEEATQLLDDLIKLDPPHQRYYEDERSVVYMDQVASDKDRLAKHCFLNDDASLCPSFPRYCLQLRSSSLTRIGSVKNLLWVQMLDLSHNKLRSVAGLEPLQQLIGLNISYNQISSFTALEPLKMLISLRILNVSFNEIGAHSVDTTRYLCSSPLSHKGGEISEACGKENAGISRHWEAALLFKSLNLVQLEIHGNAVAADENFRGLVLNILPSLRWLDGECLH